MAKKSKILIILLALVLLLVAYLVITSESVQNSGSLNQLTKDQEAADLEKNYQTSSRLIFQSYEKLIKQGNYSLADMANLKNQLLDLKVPAKYKDLHINFVLALTKLENYFNNQDEQAKNASLQMTNQLKADYGWLNS